MLSSQNQPIINKGDPLLVFLAINLVMLKKKKKTWHLILKHVIIVLQRNELQEQYNKTSILSFKWNQQEDG